MSENILQETKDVNLQDEIFYIIEEINQDNSTNYKKSVLEKHKDNKLLQRVLKMAYDRATYSYGVTMKNIYYEPNKSTNNSMSLEESLNILENEYCTRQKTGSNAINGIVSILESLSENNAILFSKILNRDLKINIGKTLINKIFKSLIVDPMYMRCDTFRKDSIDENGKEKKGTWRNIDFTNGAYIQLKADGTYREVTVHDWNVSFMSRSWETYEYPLLEKTFSKFKNGKYTGELTIKGAENRAIGNGLLNKENPPHELIIMDLWDYITLDEYQNAINGVKNVTPYEKRFKDLNNIVQQNNIDKDSNIQVIESYEVFSLKEALEKVQHWMKAWLEWGILKDKKLIFRDWTSKQQLKLKIQMDVEMRITGFIEWTPGTKREKTFGSITYSNDEWTIEWSVSWFSDEQLIDFNSRREELIGQIITIECNDITKWENNDYYALSHPRFQKIRTDKTETDTLEKVFEIKDMATSMNI